MAIEKLYRVPASSSIQRPSAHEHMAEQLRIRMTATQERLEEVEMVLDRYREYTALGIETISRQRVKIIELEDLVQEQKITVSNQRKAIAGPKKNRSRQPCDPYVTISSDSTQQGPCIRSPRLI